MKRRPDSHAAAIAASAGRRSARISQQSVLQRIRIPEGAVIASYPIDTAEDGRESVRGTSVTASAQVIASKKIDRKVKRVPPQRWQQEAWQLRRETPELRFMGDRQARACSQVRLFIGKREALDEHPAPVTDGPAAELADMMFGNAPAVEQAIRRYAQHIIYNGESLIVLTDNGNGSLEWAPHAASEITGDAPNFKLNDGVATKNIDLSKQIIVRSWTPDPEKSALPDCPVVAIMPVARELIGLTKYVSAQIDSRLAGAGLLLLPQGIESIMSSPAQRPDDYSFADELTEYMTVPIVDRDSAASVVPFVATVPPDLVDKIKHITFDSPLDPHMHERRQEAIRRIGLGMDSDPSVLLGMATANHWCVDDVTEIYTQDRGWVRESDLEIGDVVLTLNHETGMSEWQSVLDIYRAEVVDEPMRYMETQRHNSLTTGAHRWPVLVPTYEDGRKSGYRADWTTSSELTSKHAIITGAPHADLPDVPKWRDELVELVAWYWTEGNLSSSGYGCATIAQSHTVNPARVDRIRGALTRLFGAPGNGWTERVQANSSSYGGPVTVFSLRKQIADVITEHAPGREKIVRTEFIESLTLAQLELFIDVSCQGDGWHYRAGKLDIWQKNPEALAAFERALILSGRAVSTHESGEGVVVTALKSVHQRPGKARNGNRPVVIENYTGVVWCPMTSNGTWFARRNGQSFFTGNSAWAVDEAEVNLGVKPIVATACHALTQVVQPILQQMGVTDADQYVVWFDTSPLTIRPDRSKDAKELNERGVVSDETVRRETGFTDADAPGDDEHRQWLAERIILSNPSLAPALAHLVGLEDVDWSLAQGGSGSPSDDAASPASSPAEPVADTRAIPDTADNEPPADTEGPSAP